MRKHAKLRAAVIGCGAISDIYLTNLKTRFSTVEVVCCCALHPEHASAKAAQYGIESRTYQQILEDDSIQLILQKSKLPRPAQHQGNNKCIPNRAAKYECRFCGR